MWQFQRLAVLLILTKAKHKLIACKVQMLIEAKHNNFIDYQKLSNTWNLTKKNDQSNCRIWHLEPISNMKKNFRQDLCLSKIAISHHKATTSPEMGPNGKIREPVSGLFPSTDGCFNLVLIWISEIFFLVKSQDFWKCVVFVLMLNPNNVFKASVVALKSNQIIERNIRAPFTAPDKISEGEDQTSSKSTLCNSQLVSGNNVSLSESNLEEFLW